MSCGRATSLAWLWGERGRRAEARDLLAPVYGWFTEGVRHDRSERGEGAARRPCVNRRLARAESGTNVRSLAGPTICAFRSIVITDSGGR
jgi:hypothetical protein